jgi:hypothetical protein
MLNLKNSIKGFSAVSDSQSITSKTTGLQPKAELEVGVRFFIKGYP